MIGQQKINAIGSIMILFSLVSCNVYKVAEKHINKKMDKASMGLKTADINGDHIEYWDSESDKPVILLVHGFGATTKYQWYKQINQLSEHYRVVTPNLLHFGNTRPGTRKFKVADQVEMVHDLMVHLGISSYDLCGVSYGGLIGLELAVKYPAEVKKVVAFDTPVKYMYPSDIDVVCKTFDVNSIEELFAPDDEKGLKKLLYLASMKKSAVPARWMAEFYDALYAVNLEDKRTLITELIAGIEEYAEHDYSSIEVPVLLIWGSNDPVVPAERGVLLKEHIGENAHLEIVKNGAHMPNLTKHRKFNNLLFGFLMNRIDE